MDSCRFCHFVDIIWRTPLYSFPKEALAIMCLFPPATVLLSALLFRSWGIFGLGGFCKCVSNFSGSSFIHLLLALSCVFSHLCWQHSSSVKKKEKKVSSNFYKSWVVKNTALSIQLQLGQGSSSKPCPKKRTMHQNHHYTSSKDNTQCSLSVPVHLRWKSSNTSLNAAAVFFWRVLFVLLTWEKRAPWLHVSEAAANQNVLQMLVRLYTVHLPDKKDGRLSPSLHKVLPLRLDQLSTHSTFTSPLSIHQTRRLWQSRQDPLLKLQRPWLRAPTWTRKELRCAGGHPSAPWLSLCTARR